MQGGVFCVFGGVYSVTRKFWKRLVRLVGLSVLGFWRPPGGFGVGRARFADVLQRKGLDFWKGTALAARSCLLKAACCV